MSRTTALAITPNQPPVVLAEFRNAWGWSPRIWDALLGHRWMNDDIGMNRLWLSIEQLPEWQQVPLLLTFDTGVLPRQCLRWAADQLEDFDRRLPSKPEFVNHVPAMAALLRSVELEAPLLGVWGTSVSENPFEPWDDELDEPRSGILPSEMYALPQHRYLLNQAGKEVK